jgi:SNARE associated Golgi protein
MARARKRSAGGRARTEAFSRVGPCSGRLPPRKPPTAGRPAPKPRGLELAEEELREKARRHANEIRAFERRLALLRDVPGWHHVRRGRKVFLRRFVRPQERWAANMLLHQKAILYEIRLRRARAREHGPFFLGFHWAWAALPFALIGLVVLLQEKIFYALTQSQRVVARGVVSFPGRVHRGYTASREELSTAQRRKLLARALTDERVLTRRRREALLFLAVVALAFLWFAAEIAVSRMGYGIGTKRAVDLLFLYAAATRLFLPTPLEVSVLFYESTLTGPGAVLVAALGATFGSWVLFLVGARANAGLDAWFAKRKWTRVVWAWIERSADRYGHWVLGAILSIPFTPDMVAIPFTLLGMRLKVFLATVLIATTIRLSIVLWVLF